MIKIITFLAFFLPCVQSPAMDTTSVCKLMQESVCSLPTFNDAAFEALKAKAHSFPITRTLELTAHVHSGYSIGTTIAGLSLMGAVGAASFYAGIWYEGRDNSLMHVTRSEVPSINYIRVLLLCGSNPFELCDIEDEDITDEDDDGNEDDDNQIDVAQDAPFVFTRTLFNASTALHEAALTGDIELLKLFLSKKRSQDDIDMQDSDGKTALHKACESNIQSTPRCIKLLVAHGACLEAADIHGNSPLHYAICNKHDFATGTLLKLGAEVNAPNFNGDTPLHAAAGADYPFCIERLLRRGAHINVQNNQGNTAVHYSAATCNTTGLSTLLQHGARGDIPNNQKLTPCEFAIAWIQPETAQMLTDQAQRSIILALDNTEPENPLLNKISRSGKNIFTKLFNRQIGN